VAEGQFLSFSERFDHTRTVTGGGCDCNAVSVPAAIAARSRDADNDDRGRTPPTLILLPSMPNST
jgi:hypothetical protein